MLATAYGKPVCEHMVGVNWSVRDNLRHTLYSEKGTESGAGVQTGRHCKGYCFPVSASKAIRSQ